MVFIFHMLLLFLFLQSTIACDIIVCYILKGRDYYKKKKYMNVNPDDDADYQVSQIPSLSNQYDRFRSLVFEPVGFGIKIPVPVASAG